MPSLLLHSLAEFDPLITDLLSAAGARSVLEIGGGEGGLFTRQLVAWSERVGGTVHCIDPTPSQQLEDLVLASPTLTLTREPSPDALDGLLPVDAVIVDGDHNYVTVRAELALLLDGMRDGGGPRLVVLHDVAWPNARRDSYYAPERLPEDGVREHSWWLGAVPQEEQLQEAGFSPAGHMAYALQSGGPANGVLTAVEDALSEREGLDFHVIPAVFGLGVIFGSDADWAPAARELLTAGGQGGLLERLERNRLELFIELLRLQGELDRRSRVHQLQLDELRRRPVIE